MAESWRTRLERWGFNFFPTYRSTGAWITYIADDYHEIRIKIPLGWRTKNYVGTMFGGSMYASGALYGRFVLSAEEIDGIRAAAAGGEPVERLHRVALVDRENVVHVEIEWLVHIRRRDASRALRPTTHEG